MPDIKMCHGGTCSKKKTCFRYTAKPSVDQPYFEELPLKRDGSCDFYLPEKFLELGGAK